MPLKTNIRICTHIKVNGLPCGSPSLRGEVFCYFHQRMFRGVRTPPNSRLHPIALLEDPEGIQASLMEVINAMVRNTIDLHRAQLILRALHIAVRNCSHVRFDTCKSQMVRDVPDYPAPPVQPALPAASKSAAAAARRAKSFASALSKASILAVVPFKLSQRELPPLPSPAPPRLSSHSASIPAGDGSSPNPRRWWDTSP